MPRYAGLLILTLAALASGDPAGAATCTNEPLALIMANAGYTKIAKLTNPINDATVVARALQGRGFAVGSKIDMAAADVSRFLVAIQKNISDHAPVAAFYYAGYGAPVERRPVLMT